MTMPFTITDTTAANSSVGLGGGDMAFPESGTKWDLVAVLGTVIVLALLYFYRPIKKKK